MPVKKKKTQKEETTVRAMWSGHADAFTKKIFLTLFGILLAYMIVLVGTMIRNNLQTFEYIGQADRSERMMTIDAVGKVTATPDVASVTMGMIAEGSSVAEAQEENTKVVNDLIDRLAQLGVDKTDIKTTEFSVYPRYSFDDGDRELEGYEVRQSVQIKIRDLDNANAVLALAGTLGLNTVGGLQFTLDEPDVYVAEARALALEKIQEKAIALREQLGVRFVSIVSYNEYQGGNVGPYPQPYAADVGFGGGVSPSVQEGSSDVLLNVQVTFEIR